MDRKRRARVACGIAAMAIAVVACGDASRGGGVTIPPEGPLARKAAAYDRNYVDFHMPFLGGSLKTRFACETCTDDVVAYESAGDSAIWSGNYLASQAFRYAVTRSPEALANVRRVMGFMDVLARVTGRTGFLARYAGPADDPRVFPANCATDENCHVVAGGEFDGLFWLGNTSRDQYSGWFFGLGWVHALVDDPDLNALIRARIVEVVDRLVADDYTIVDVDGRPTTAGPEALPPFALNWLLIRALITEEPGDLAFYEAEAERLAPLFPLTTLSILNHFIEYYGFHLSFMNLWTLARNEADADRRAFYRESFDRNVWGEVARDRQAMFDLIALDVLDVEDPDALAAQVRADLLDFQEPPRRRISRSREGLAFEIDPRWEALRDFVALFDPDYARKFQPIATEPFPVAYRCHQGFMWQQNPYLTECAPDDPAYEYAPMDFLVAYWMARWMGVLGEED